MYLDHWSLEYPPFEPHPDSRFLFATPQHEQALAVLGYAVRDGGEPALLRGAPGCGKTLLLRCLRRDLPQARYHVAYVPEVACSQVGLLRRVAYHLTQTIAADAEAALAAISAAAQESARQDTTIVLMLDDWPAEASEQVLEELRWLLNLDAEGCRVVVLLAGENVDPRQHWPGWLAQRLCTTAVVGPLTPQQVPAYLTHRLRVATAVAADAQTHAHIFEPQAAAAVATWSGGVPRLINRLAHLALHVAYLDLAPRVSAAAVDRAIERLSAGTEVGVQNARC